MPFALRTALVQVVIPRGPVYRASSSPASVPAQQRREKNPSGKRDAQHRHRVVPKLPFPVRSRLHLLLQLLKIGAEFFPGILDVRLYLICSFFHSTFSFTVSSV